MELSNIKKIIILSITFLLVIVGYFIYQRNKITISVVIPIYNSEKYLNRCLDSVLAQNGNFEIIAVNDGSTDSSLKILQEYAKKYKNIEIINQKNQGTSTARNVGIKKAKNKYITFIDNDDWLEPNAFEKAIKIIKKDNPDILLSSFYDVYDRQWVKDTRGEAAASSVQQETKFIPRDLDMLSIFSPFYAENAHSQLYYANTSIHGHFIRKDFIKKHNIMFPDGVALAEDAIFIYKIFLHNAFVSVLKEPIYDYYNRADSLSKSIKILTEALNILTVMEKTAEFKNAPRYIQFYIRDNFLGLINLGISNLIRHNKPIKFAENEIIRAQKIINTFNAKERKICKNCRKIEYLMEQLGY